MGKQFALGLGVGLAMSVSVALADGAPAEDSSVLVRAWGANGEVRALKEPAPEDAALPPEVKAGAIARATLSAEQKPGIGRFLQQVRVQPAFDQRGRFKGWRLVSLFAKRSDVKLLVLREGDVLLRINGQSIERPERFKDVWDSLAKAKELVLDIERDGHESKLVYTITP